MGFSYGNSLCTEIKLMIVTCGLIVGMVGYGATEAIVRSKENSMPEEETREFHRGIHVDAQTNKEDVVTDDTFL